MNPKRSISSIKFCNVELCINSTDTDIPTNSNTLLLSSLHHRNRNSPIILIHHHIHTREHPKCLLATPIRKHLIWNNPRPQGIEHGGRPKSSYGRWRCGWSRRMQAWWDPKGGREWLCAARRHGRYGNCLGRFCFGRWIGNTGRQGGHERCL